MPVTLDQLRGMIQVEYDNLVARFGLSPVPLDVYEVDESGNGGYTLHGTDRRNVTPGYTPTHLVLPEDPENLRLWKAEPPPFPPKTFALQAEEWPLWRVELWHEIVHQYQHQVLNKWDPKHGGHVKGWPDAVCDFATSFGISPTEQLGVL